MTRTIIEQRLKAYAAKSAAEEFNAMKEILQEVALCGLARASAKSICLGAFFKSYSG